MLSQYKRKKNTTKTAVMNAKRKSAPGKKKDFKIVKIPNQVKKDSSSDSDSDGDSSSDSDLDEYEELLLNSIRLPESKQKKTEKKPTQPTPEAQPTPEVQPTPQPQPTPEAQPQPQSKPAKRRSRKKVIKKYYINKKEPKKVDQKQQHQQQHQQQFDQGRRVSYIGMGSFPLQSNGLRSRIINF